MDKPVSNIIFSVIRGQWSLVTDGLPLLLSLISNNLHKTMKNYYTIEHSSLNTLSFCENSYFTLLFYRTIFYIKSEFLFFPLDEIRVCYTCAKIHLTTTVRYACFVALTLLTLSNSWITSLICINIFSINIINIFN